MFEFDSVTVSSFDAASLSDQLTERSADGWDVVAVVPAGNDIVAYLRKGSASASMSAADEDATMAATLTADPADTAAPAADVAPMWGAEQRSEPEPEPESEPVATATAERDDATVIQPSKASHSGSGSSWGSDSSSSSSGESAGWAASSSSSSSESNWGGSSAQQASTPSVAAGWYADPAGRYELRYWDGNAWTEHVSRGGQQSTDPPVA